MNTQDKPKFGRILFGLAELLGGKLSDAGLEMYFHVLSRFSIEQIEIAANQMLATAQRFPVPAQFIEAIEGKPQDRGEKAWDLFIEAVRRGGSWKSLYASDSAFIAAISRCYGGWMIACELLPTPEDPMFAAQKKAFLASYHGAQHDHGNTHYLAGRSETNNRKVPRLLPEGQDTFKAQILCVTDRVSFREMEFDAETGMLSAQSQRLLSGVQPLRLAA